ncbi:MAG: hypothetical protein DWQ01_02190 [Planctomycetota bacterium]|nr:MAG: hypothetical protein DWQ01_02190 [Planctomycetota bacterium]
MENSDAFTRYVVHLVTRPEVPRPESLVREHVAFLKDLEAQDRLDFAGPFHDGKGGLLILRAASMDEAQATVAQDPFVIAGSSRAEIRAIQYSCPENQHLGMG